MNQFFSWALAKRLAVFILKKINNKLNLCRGSTTNYLKITPSNPPFSWRIDWGINTSPNFSFYSFFLWWFFQMFIRTHVCFVEGQFHVKGPRKKVNIENWIFFYEMWKILWQIDDFDCFLNNSCNFGAFLAKNLKYLKMTVLKKWKLKIKMFFFLRLNNLLQISYISFL